MTAVRWTSEVVEMKFVEKVVRKVNRRAILIAVMGAMLVAVLTAMPVGVVWPLPISLGLLEEIHVVLVGGKLLQKVSTL